MSLTPFSSGKHWLKFNGDMDAATLLAELGQLDADLRALAQEFVETDHDEYKAAGLERRLGYLDGLEFAAHMILVLLDGDGAKR